MFHFDTGWLKTEQKERFGDSALVFVHNAGDVRDFACEAIKYCETVRKPGLARLLKFSRVLRQKQPYGRLRPS